MKRYILIIALLALFPACAMFGKGKPFPEESMKKLVTSIEDAVRQGDREAKIPECDGLTAASTEFAQLLRTRAARYPAYQELMDAGYGYEEQDGLVAINATKDYRKATKSRERARHALVVLQENNDRWAMYDTLLKENKIGGGKLKQLRAIFGAVRVGGMPQGWLYQDADGKIVGKTQ
jgi:hypothetical protein